MDSFFNGSTQIRSYLCSSQNASLSQDDFPLASLPLLGYAVGTPEESDGIHKEYVFKLQFKSHVYFFRAESEYTFERYGACLKCGESAASLWHRHSLILCHCPLFRWMEVIKSAARTTGRMSLLIPKGGPVEMNGNWSMFLESGPY